MVLTYKWCPVDFITVSETAVEPPQDEEGMNSPTDLAMEATFINQNFSQQVLRRVSNLLYSNTILIIIGYVLYSSTMVGLPSLAYHQLA